MQLSILIVNWNTRDLVLSCVASVLQNPPPATFEIFVVDNASSDGSLKALRDAFGREPRVKILAANTNLGFAKATNRAFAESRGELVLLLNPDAEVRPGALEELVGYLDQHPGVGVVGAKIVNPDGTVQPSVRRYPELGSSLLVYAGLHRILRPKKYLMDGFDYDRTAEVDQVMGAALLTRRAIIEQLGFLDERFWLWYEEVDFCQRVKAAGYKIMYNPGARVVHRGAQSFSQLSVFRRKQIMGRSLKYYFAKRGRAGAAALVALFTPFVLLAAWLLDLALKSLKTQKTRPNVNV